MLKVFGEATSCFGFPTTDKLAKELDLFMEENPDFEYFKLGKTGLEYFVAGEKADVSVITDDSIDAEKEVMDIKSIDFSPVNDRKLVAFNHNYNIPPVGKSLWIKTVGNKVKAKTQYAVDPPEGISVEKWFPATVFHMIKGGYLPGKSLGGIAKKVEPTAEEIAANPLLKDVKFIRKNAKVYEYSVVTLNCNKNAVVEEVSKGLLTAPTELIDVFPELSDIVEQIRKSKEPIKIGKYTSVEDLQKQISERLLNGMDGMAEEIMDKVQSRVLGRV